jgi:2,3-bisphosphoglycerate-independent phosphoglycerate mutase
MKRIVLIFPGAITQDHEDIWRSPPPGLAELQTFGEVVRLATQGDLAELVGLPAGQHLPAGPLVVAAFGWEPPPRSVHFELTLRSVDEHGLIQHVSSISPQEANEIAPHLERLTTRSLIPKWGEQTHHGLIWLNGSLDLMTKTPAETANQHWTQNLPEGDGEPLLRQLIDDSLNLLDTLPLNRRRVDEGLPKANLLWPHSFGFRPDLPNLAIRRGSPATIWSDDLRLQGLAQLVGYRHCSRAEFRSGMHISPHLFSQITQSDGDHILIDKNIATMITTERPDEARYALEIIDHHLITPLADQARSGHQIALAILCPRTVGLLVSQSAAANAIPFDSRPLDDPRARRIDLAEAVNLVLTTTPN